MKKSFSQKTRRIEGSDIEVYTNMDVSYVYVPIHQHTEISRPRIYNTQDCRLSRITFVKWLSVTIPRYSRHIISPMLSACYILKHCRHQIRYAGSIQCYHLSVYIWIFSISISQTFALVKFPLSRRELRSIRTSQNYNFSINYSIGKRKLISKSCVTIERSIFFKVCISWWTWTLQQKNISFIRQFRVTHVTPDGHEMVGD